MTEAPQPNRNGLIPDIAFGGGRGKDVADLYTRMFNAEVLPAFTDSEGRVMHGELIINGSYLYYGDDMMEMNPTEAPTTTLYLTFPDDQLDAAWQRAIDAGAEVVLPLEQQFWGARYGVIKDPLGQHWSFSNPGEEVSEEDMQAAMAAMNDAPADTDAQ